MHALGADDPRVAEAGQRALAIISHDVDGIHDEIIDRGALPADSELARLDRSLAPGPLSFSGSVMAALDATRGALDQLGFILEANPPCTPIVLHTLLRAALVGAARAALALLPTDPTVRLENARMVLALDSKGLANALGQYAKFGQLQAFRPPADVINAAEIQWTQVRKGEPIGDGKVVTRMIEAIAEALQHATGSDEHAILTEHATWLWTAYSGAAHTYSWPRLLSSVGSDWRVFGDYLGDLYQVTVVGHVAMRAVRDRAMPGSAETVMPVDLGPV